VSLLTVLIQLKHVIGNYREGNESIWNEDALLIDSAHNFKVRGEPTVALTDCGIAQLDDLSMRLQFVGLTRVHLEWLTRQERWNKQSGTKRNTQSVLLRRHMFESDAFLQVIQ
jgi:hypothetical protein